MAFLDGTPRLLGFGAALIDEMSLVSEDFVQAIPGRKGGALQVSLEEMARLQASLPEKPIRKLGGAAANTIRAYAGLGGIAGMLTQAGDDDLGKDYLNAMKAAKVICDPIQVISGGETGRCLTLVTPDSQRTMRTRQGVANLMRPQDFSAKDFQGYTHLFAEGYGLYIKETTQAVLATAKAAGLTVAWDAGSPELVAKHRDYLKSLLSEYISIAFFNEDESAAFCGSSDPLKGLEVLSQYCSLAVVKIGKAGAYISLERSTPVFVPAVEATAVDTTGAGDFWAAGFLHAWLNGASLERAGKTAACMAAAVVAQIGTEMDADFWKRFDKGMNHDNC